MLNSDLFMGVSLDCLPIPGTCWQFRTADPCVPAPGSAELPLQQQRPSRILFPPWSYGYHWDIAWITSIYTSENLGLQNAVWRTGMQDTKQTIQAVPGKCFWILLAFRWQQRIRDNGRNNQWDTLTGLVKEAGRKQAENKIGYPMGHWFIPLLYI